MAEFTNPFGGKVPTAENKKILDEDFAASMANAAKTDNISGTLNTPISTTPPRSVTGNANVSNLAPVNTITSSLADNAYSDLEKSLSNLQAQSALDIQKRQAELDLQGEQEAAKITKDYESKRRTTEAAQGEETASSKALQFKLGRTATPYAEAEGQKLRAAQNQQLQDLEDQKNELIYKSRQAIQENKYRVAKELQEQANQKFNQQLSIKQEQRAQQAQSYSNLKSEQDLIKGRQEILKQNAGVVANSLLDYDTVTGKVTMPSTEELNAISEQTGIPVASLLAEVRTKAYELSKLSGEDRLRELNIQKAQADLKFEGMDADQKSWQTALQKGWVPEGTSFGEYLKMKKQAETITDTSDMTPGQQQRFIGITNKYQENQVIRAGEKGYTAIQIADEVLKNPGNAASQISLLYTLVKNLDPDSAVREGEIALAQSTQSYFSKFKTTFEKIDEGKIISEKSAVELAKETKNLAKKWSEAAQNKEQQFRSQAIGAGLGKKFDEYLGRFDQVYKDTGTKEYTSWDEMIKTVDDGKVKQFESLLQDPTFGNSIEERKANILEYQNEKMRVGEMGSGPIVSKFVQKAPVGTKGGQCGIFTRQLVDFPSGMGNAWSEKQAFVRKNGILVNEWKKNPKVGDVVFAHYDPTYGHAMVINEILPGGKFKVSESNWKGDERVDHNRIVDINDPKIYGAVRGKLKV